VIPLDLSVGADVAGAPPLAVTEGDWKSQGGEEPSGEVERLAELPRLSLTADFHLPSAAPNTVAIVAVTATHWSGDYALGIDYDAAIVEVGSDLLVRGYPVPEPGPRYDGLRIRPWGEAGVGLRGVALFQRHWSDIGTIGYDLRAGAGAEIGSVHRHLALGVRYEAVVAGEGWKGVLDSAAQDMKWKWNPSGARLWVTVGTGWR
jgi:hypothetical protein